VNILKKLIGLNRRNKLKNYNFQQHTSDKRPVPMNVLVVYRTKAKGIDQPKSHIHMPQVADKLNWSADCALGRIVEYAVVGAVPRKGILR
jgi:hypothetical protein